MKTWKTRHQFYLPDDLSEALDQLARRSGSSKSAILTEALRTWIERQGARELDDRFGPRLDRQLTAIRRIEEVATITAEVLDLFVQHQLTLVAHQPPFSEETGALGLRRYRQFMDQVARRLAAKGGGAGMEVPNAPVDDARQSSGERRRSR